jgi:hypothetical protein
MRLFPFPNNPYGPFDTGNGSVYIGLSARQRTTLVTSPFTPFDLSMVDGDPPPDVQDTIFPETATLRDAAMFLQWRFAAARVEGTGDDAVTIAERIVLW